jgi:CRP/FNR family transcriptional regulator, cyclic AMP receptor protein
MAAVDPTLLQRVTVFSTCTPEQLARLAEEGEITEHVPGDKLTQEGVVGHRFHLILDGEARVTRGGATVSTVGRGSFVGEIGLLGGGPSTATVTATAPTRCLTLRREGFWQTLEDEPAIALRILEVVCRRLQEERREPSG